MPSFSATPILVSLAGLARLAGVEDLQRLLALDQLLLEDVEDGGGAVLGVGGDLDRRLAGPLDLGAGALEVEALGDLARRLVRALSTSWRSILLTMSNDESAMVAVLLLDSDGSVVLRYPSLVARPLNPGVPSTAGCPSGQWKRTVNPSAYAFAGSNPAPATTVHAQHRRPLPRRKGPW